RIERAIIIGDIERKLAFESDDREHEKLGYDSREPRAGTGKLRFYRSQKLGHIVVDAHVVEIRFALERLTHMRGAEELNDGHNKVVGIFERVLSIQANERTL